MSDYPRRATDCTRTRKHFGLLHSLLRNDIVHVHITATRREWIGLLVGLAISQLLSTAAFAALACHAAFITAGGGR